MDSTTGFLGVLFLWYLLDYSFQLLRYCVMCSLYILEAFFRLIPFCLYVSEQKCLDLVVICFLIFLGAYHLTNHQLHDLYRYLSNHKYTFYFQQFSIFAQYMYFYVDFLAHNIKHAEITNLFIRFSIFLAARTRWWKLCYTRAAE